MERRAVLIALAALAGCSALPRDPEGTTERVRRTGVIRVGYTEEVRTYVGGGELVNRLERATNARARSEEGDTEALLARLQTGHLDVVFATFDPATPWKDRVALGPPLFKGWDLSPAKERMELRAAVRNGENRWAMLVETQSRAVADGAR